MPRLIVVSNRIAATGSRPDTGGLAVALREALAAMGGIWLGWSGRTSEEPASVPARLEMDGAVRLAIDLPADDAEAYYAGFANRTLWPLLHYRLDLLTYDAREFAAYERVNARFAAALLPLLRPDDIVWVHDYHLFMLGRHLRKAGVRQRIGFFLHTPFPTRHVFAALPSHREIASALAAYDLVGTQTADDAAAMRNYLVHEAGGRGTAYAVELSGNQVQIDHFPVGIDVDAVQRIARSSATTAPVRRLVNSLEERKLVIGVDRLDYSKGLPQRIQAYRHFLDSRPAASQDTVYMQIAPVTREHVPEFDSLHRAVDEAVGHINGSFGEIDRMPIRYLSRSFAQSKLFGLYRVASCALVTPLRDGMNLVAKEFIAAQPAEDPGALVLSRFAGAAGELDAALIVNPFDTEATGRTIARALAMPLDERRERYVAMMAVLRRNDLTRWRESFLQTLTGDLSANASQALPPEILRDDADPLGPRLAGPLHR